MRESTRSGGTDDINVSSLSIENDLKLDYRIDPDGLSTEVEVRFSGSRRISAQISHWRLRAIISELEAIHSEMRNLQRLTVDRGSGSLRDICRRALEPAQNDVIIDPETGNIIYLMQFPNSPAVAIKMSPLALKIAWAKTNEALARLAN